MKLLFKTVFSTWLLCLIGCNESQEPQKAQCGCDSDAEATINNISGKIEFDTSKQPIFYRLQGYYATGLAVCNDSTFQTLLAQNKIMNGDSVVFGGEAKHTCTDCEFCGLISITSLTKK
ncbi:hypothetical protein [Dyadobacter psychrophilus]|uniref:Uncharacterized protein n=1 Tax=Dyadobacter psychrophilus TaxID=651661 RepID=A0A1T5HEJ6_9BACT|nr:hypothetical protein [Dyadobacter psychrophilus]SKC19092.1 hypothetical protein SAMN05660293_05425 [Dyadobacter psychrophilus]